MSHNETSPMTYRRSSSLRTGVGAVKFLTFERVGNHTLGHANLVGVNQQGVNIQSSENHTFSLTHFLANEPVQ